MDAELLLAHVLGRSRAGLVTLDAVDAADAARFAELLDQRADRVPLQHLTGRAPFRLIELAVGPGVFAPRPETELLVEWALERIAGAEPTEAELRAAYDAAFGAGTDRHVHGGEHLCELGGNSMGGERR